MSYTDADVERVAEAIYKADPCFYTYNAGDWEPSDFYSDDLEEHWREVARKHARTALEAMERDPLENVLDAIGGYVSEVGRNPGHTDGWQAVVVKEPYQHFGTGATIDEAIRSAVATAKGEEA